MQTRTLISVLTLIAFLPLATGCSSPQTVRVENDPAADETAVRLNEGKPVEIVGYSTWSDGYESWRGTVFLASPDSLEFVPDWSVRGQEKSERRRFRVPRHEVATLDVVRPDGAKTVAVVAVVVATLAIVMFVSLARGINEAFEYQGPPKWQ